MLAPTSPLPPGGARCGPRASVAAGCPLTSIDRHRRAPSPVEQRGHGSHSCYEQSPDKGMHVGVKSARVPRQMSIWLPSSMTRLVGSLKNCMALSAFRTIHAKSFSRQTAMPGRLETISVSRERK